jgi:hypothetical protein
LQYPPDPPTVEEIIAVMRAAGETANGLRLRGLLFDPSVDVEAKLCSALVRRIGVDLPASDDALGTHGCSPNQGSVR